jgi:hypothetical protein
MTQALYAHMNNKRKKKRKWDSLKAISKVMGIIQQKTKHSGTR